MGYPMTYTRLVGRNGLMRDYTDAAPYRDETGGVAQRDRVVDLRCTIGGDMRRLEQDSRDPRHLDAYARATGLAPEQVNAVLDAFFEASFAEFDWERFPKEDPELVR